MHKMVNTILFVVSITIRRILAVTAISYYYYYRYYYYYFLITTAEFDVSFPRFSIWPRSAPSACP